MKPFGSMGKWQVTPEPGQPMKEDRVGGRRWTENSASGLDGAV